MRALLVLCLLGGIAGAQPIVQGTGVQIKRGSARPCTIVAPISHGCAWADASGNLRWYNGSTDQNISASSGGGLTIGASIGGASASSVLFADGSLTLAQGALTFNPASVGTLTIGTLGAGILKVNVVEMGDGSSAAISGTGAGRLRYNNSTQAFEASLNGGAYAALSSGSAPSTRTITTTSPLSGGGDLSADRTFSIAAAGIGNSLLTNPSLTVNTTSPLTGGGVVALGAALTVACTTCVVTSGSYSDPTWVSALAGSKISGAVANATTATSFSGALAGDVTGNQGTTLVVKLQGFSLDSGTPTSNEALIWNNGTSKWTATAITESMVTNLSTDLAARALAATTITAGTNLTGGGDLSTARTIALASTLTGVTMSGSSNTFSNIAESSVTNLTTDLAAKAIATRSIATSSGLQGGGDLSADRTLSVRLNASGGLASNLGVGTNELGVPSGGIVDAMLASGITGSKISGAVASATTATNFSGALVGIVSGTQGATTIAAGNVTDTMLASGITASKITGAVASATTAVSFSGALVGDVTGTQGATALPAVGPGAGAIGGGGTYIASVTLDAKGRVTAATTGTPSGSGGYATIQSPAGTPLTVRTVFSVDGTELVGADNSGSTRTDITIGSGITRNTSSQTLTNKTLTAPIINGLTSASGNADLSGSSGTFKTTTGASTFGGSSNSFTNAITIAPATNQLTLGAAGHVVVISSTAPAASTQTITLADAGGADSFALLALAQTLTNKSISGSSNTITNIAESSVTNLTTDLAAKPPGARLVSTGAGLSGGGDLTADRTLTTLLNASGGLVKNLGAGTNELGIGAAGVTNAMLANNTIGVTAGTGLSGGGTPALGSSATVSMPNVGPGATTTGGGSVYVNSITTDAQGRITTIATGTPAGGGGTGNWTFSSDAADDTGANIMTIGATTATGVTLSRSAGTITMAAATVFAANIGMTVTAGTSAFDLSGGTGLFKTSTGASTFGGSTNTFSSGKVGPASGQQHTLPAVTSDTIALLAAAQTFTNKTLTTPTMSAATSAANTAIITRSVADTPGAALSATKLIGSTSTTAATVSVNQWSLPIELCSAGWKTTATAASQQTCTGEYNMPLTGTTTPAASRVFYGSLNGGAGAAMFQMIKPISGTVTYLLGGAQTTVPATNAGAGGIGMDSTGGLTLIPGAGGNANISFANNAFDPSVAYTILLGHGGQPFSSIGVRNIESWSTKPTCSIGTGAGTGATCSVATSSTDMGGQVTVNTGTTPAASGATIVTVTAAAGSYTAAAWCTIDDGDSVTTAARVAGQYAPNHGSGATTTILAVKNNGSGLTASTTGALVINYVCVGGNN